MTRSAAHDETCRGTRQVIAELAAQEFKDHVLVREDVVGATWCCARPGTGLYGFRVLFALFDRAMTADEIAALYEAGRVD